ncbi:MAG: MBL fold metallo-hydrolase [Candidatus Rariloculaceae bacterium]
MEFRNPLPRFAAFAVVSLFFGATQASAQTLNVTLLGTGDPTPVMEHFGPATLVEAGDHQMLFDVGRGASIRLWQLGVSLGDIDEVFITHFHQDHINGLVDVWMTGWQPPPYGRRVVPWRVFGPTGIADIMAGFRQAMEPNIQIRIIDEQLPPSGAELDITEFDEDGIVFDEDGIVVRAFAVDHGEFIKPTYGYRVDYNGHSVVISGDTRFDENIIAMSEGIDLLVHEVVAAHPELVDFDPRIQLIIDHHTTPQQAGVVFERAAPKLAAYTHYVLLSAPGVPAVTVDEVVEMTRETYSGPLQAGADLMRFEIGDTVEVIPFSQ